MAGVKDKVALKLIAAKGKVQVQAQSDAMELTADKDVTITSCKERIVVNAKQEILLTSGGAYIRLKGGNIEIHCPGTVSVKGASHNLSGPASMDWALPEYKKITCTEQIDAQLLTESHPELCGNKYVYYCSDTGNKLKSGTLDANGLTDRIHLQGVNNIKALIGSGKWEIL
ncbi:putative Vgr-related protein [Aquitalea magnusonii]|uniref:Putative Vgr-related protein n=1 Tax=Aquitalea magnusonii TaxID=332411 RepID=A0A3G9GHX6_9NEIS|nr:putative Vgr-related protein [Aquitalea magnusonii]